MYAFYFSILKIHCKSEDYYTHGDLIPSELFPNFK